MRVTRWKGWALGLLGRRLLATHTRMADALDRQNVLLARIADHLAPAAATPDTEDDLRRTTGPQHLDERELAIVLDFHEAIRRTHGRDPSDAEVVEYLAWDETRRATLRR